MTTYILGDDGEPLKVDPLVHVIWHGTTDHEKLTVARTEWISREILVSTIFIGIDVSGGLSKSPLLWETLVLGGPLDMTQRRYVTREEAIIGHHKVVKEVELAILYNV